MNQTLLKRISAYIGGGAFAIAFAMLSGHSGLEGREYKAYFDVAGVLTVCDGHTGKDIIPGKTYTDVECDAITKKDLRRIADKVDQFIKVPISETERAAYYSFAYNVGPWSLPGSKLLRKLNSGDRKGACEALKEWVYATDARTGKKVVWKGLVNRRDVEYAVCSWKK